MIIYKTTNSRHYINTVIEQEKIEDVKIIGMIDKSYLISFVDNGVKKVDKFKPIQFVIFFEILNNSPLWSYEITLSKIHNPIVNYYAYNRTTKLDYIISIKPELINGFLNTSIGLNYLTHDKYNNLPCYTLPYNRYHNGKRYNEININNTSYLPYYDKVKQPDCLKIKLYNYQKQSLNKMIEIEKGNFNQKINYIPNFDYSGINIYFNPISGLKVDKEDYMNISSKGGILADKMGLGKTITSLCLIPCNPSTYTEPFKNNLIYSKATLLICPSHLAKQWNQEVEKCLPHLKVITILTKRHHSKLTYNDIINADLVIVTQQFLMNFNYYPRLKYKRVTASSVNIGDRNSAYLKLLTEMKKDKSIKEIGNLELPLIEHFFFHRLLVDEGHEIFSEMLKNACMSSYMVQWIKNVKTNYYWYISGTPFANFTGICNCLEFIKLKLQKYDDINPLMNFEFTFNDFKKCNILTKKYFIDRLLPKVCIRHLESDVKNQIDIPGYEEEVIWVDLTDVEKDLYNSKKERAASQILQQLCCHPLIAESFKLICGNKKINLDEIKTELISYNKNRIILYTKKLKTLSATSRGYSVVKSSYERIVSESTYMISVLTKIDEKKDLNKENCSICYDQIKNPSLTSCGHCFCYECLTECLKLRPRCPICQTKLLGKEVYMLNNVKKEKKEEKKEDSLNPLIKKYGSKLGKIISLVRKLVAKEDTRIIIFSRWDTMLTLIGQSLADNGIENSFIKGNVWCRNSAISKFKLGKNKKGDDNKVIMLSLKNAASGTNLTEATHIFFVEPINAPVAECKSIEGQAIGRACRIGQKNKIKVIRVLTKNTIEQDIYNKYYNKLDPKLQQNKVNDPINIEV